MPKLSLKRALLEGAGYEEYVISVPERMLQVPGQGLAYMSGDMGGGCTGEPGGCGCSACELNHQDEPVGGDELRMVLANLDRIESFAHDLSTLMAQCDDVEEWVQEKIATVEDRLEAVHGYISYKMKDKMGNHTLHETSEVEEEKTSKYDDEMKKKGFSRGQSKKLPDELQAALLRKRR